jgi:hypothetical protein
MRSAKQLTQLQGQLERAGFRTLATRPTHDGGTDYATGQLALLANLPPGGRTHAAFAGTTIVTLARNLPDAPAILNQTLSANVPPSDNPIKSRPRGW